MAANPNIAPRLELVSKQETAQVVEMQPLSLKKRILNLLLEIFEGHEEFLGRTPD
jgi:hypothetical protein